MAQALEGTPLPAQAAAGATVVTEIGEVTNVQGTDNAVNKVQLTPPPGFATVTGVATNNATFNVRTVRGGTVGATLASVTLAAGTNLVAETPLTVPVTGTQGQTTSLQEGDVLDVQMVQNGTGIVIGAGIVPLVEIQ